MKITIVDDNKRKREEIKKYITECFLRLNIKTKPCFEEFSYRNEYLIYLRKNKEMKLEDLLILDWNFPIYEDSFPKKGTGLFILNELNRLDLKIPVIICSSEEVESNDEDFTNVIGSIKEDSFIYQLDEWMTLIEAFFKDKEKD